jgi:POT family proton-dependent oligopeptide transporter
MNSAFLTVFFSIPIIGGYLSGRFLGYAFSTIICLILAIGGLYSLCFQSPGHFYAGLAMFAIGNSIAVSCLYIMLGRLLPEGKQKRIAGFTIAYTTMNGGALVSLLLSGTIIRNWGYQSAFLLSAILLLFATFTLILNLKNITPDSAQYNTTYQTKQRIFGVFCILALIPIVMALLKSAQHNAMVLSFIAAVALVLIIQIWRSASVEQRGRLKTFFIVTAFAAFFWALYSLEPSVLTLFVERNVDREIWGFSIPSSDFYSLNPLFIIILGTLFSLMWLSLGRAKQIPSLPYIFAVGIGLVGIAYLLLSASTYFANESGLINMGWIMLSYVMLSASELFISPIGLSMIGPLSENKNEGVLMGVWLLSNGIGSSLSGYLSETTISSKQTINPLITNALYGYRFCEFGLIALLLGAILALLAPRLIKVIRITTTQTT